jgi:hypothetical protein
VVCFDEVAGVSFDQKDGVNILKGYMASGEFSRGKESIRAEGGIVMVGNFDVDVEQQQRIGHLLSPLPREMRDDTAFQDRIHAYAPGWDFPKLNPNEHLSSHFGLVSDFLSECWSRLRDGSRLAAMQNRIHLGGALSGRDIEGVNKTVSALIKLLFPDPEMEIPDEDLEWIVRLALESRRRVKEQQKRCLKSEFRNTHFSYTLGLDGWRSSWPPPSSTATTPLTAIRCRLARCGPSAPALAKPAPASTESRWPLALAAAPRSSISRFHHLSAKAQRWASRTFMGAPRVLSVIAILAVMSSPSSCAPWTTIAVAPVWAYL